MKLHKYKLSVKIIQIRKENLAGAEWKSGCGGALIREVPKQTEILFSRDVLNLYKKFVYIA